ncbi:hypothetical protein [Natribacillus halophilus]|uniref:Ethanolamine utilization protein n=1 Tax=Natribacillus halophilus TaxID=549003 RepID=A0A1G8N1X3_9BACI|nr:hypothetical protein [Natribacillus halophilus]SDI73600.1 hypothetical protein SAMN04488123_105132 [Natribacillus halophilus]
MDRKKQSAVVTYTLRALLTKNQSEVPQRPEILALLARHMVGMEQGFSALNVLKSQGATVYLCMEPSVLNAYSRKEIRELTGIDAFVPYDRLEETKARFSSFFIPVLSFSFISDLLRFNEQRLFTQTILWALMKGKTVTALEIGSNPYHSIWDDNGLNQGSPFFKHELKNQLNQFRGFGIKMFADEQEVKQYFFSPFTSKRIITAKEIEQMVSQSHSEIFIDSRTVITPLAQDLAKENKIEIYKE